MPRDSDPNFTEESHGWRRSPRIRASDYTAKFLSDLQTRQQVFAVDESWTEEKGPLPPGINWVLYPNGDLQRVGVD